MARKKTPRKDSSNLRFWIVDGDDVPPPEKKVELTPHNAHLIDDDGPGVESPGVRAKRLRARMLQFNELYNLAWHVRAAQHGREGFRLDKVDEFAKVLLRELQNCKDPEALLYAVADALTAYPRGLPWER